MDWGSPMLVCNVVGVWNASSKTATVVSREWPPGRSILIPAGGFQSVANGVMTVPWCNAAPDFGAHRIDVSVGARSFQVWQADPGSSERIRLSADGAWHWPGDVIGGYAAVGFLEAESLLGLDRVLIVHDRTLWMLPPIIVGPLRAASADAIAHAMHISGDDDPRRETAVLSVAKSSAAAFSMGGIPSDALLQHRAGAQWLYRDSGKRYEFAIAANGSVTVSPPPAPVPSFASPGKLVPPLSEAISFNRKRKGELIPLPVLDLVAANGGRVFAKEKGTDRLFFAILDEMFVHGDSRRTFAIPSTYFKLDPEAGTAGANPADLTTPMDGDFGRHPAAQRFPLFRLALPLGFMPIMDVRVWRGAWHLLDARPPSNAMARAVEALVGPAIPIAQTLANDLPGNQGRGIAQSALAILTFAQQGAQALDSTPSGPSYNHVQFAGASGTSWEQSIAVASVRDIGVSHVHMHQQDESISGGEMQMLLARSTPGLFANHRELYQFLNGPIADADGFNDGTCNFYLLAQLAGGKYAVLYIDEQTFFSQRWRYASPDDHGGASMALTGDLAANPAAYEWNRATFWSPFDTAGLVGPRSRMAVSAYVVLVSGDFQPGSAPPPIYSLNFSWGTMDRTWRWRPLPAGTVARELGDPANETVPPEATDTVYPQTIRLRDDMTLHVKGSKGGVVGRFCQRYLPADNVHVPMAGQLVAGARPATGYSHPWKFFAEPAFRNADRFSHFGAYDDVDSRTQYHRVDAASFAALDAAHVAPDDFWIDVEGKLTITAYPFALDTLQTPWFPWPPFPKSAMHPASLYNDAVLLRFVKRGAHWVALRADKRDDDMVPYDVVPSTPITFARRGRDGSARPGTVAVTLQPAVVLPAPPAVRNAFFWWEGANAGVAYWGTDVARVRMASFDATGAVVQMLDASADAFAFDKPSSSFIYRWTPPPDIASQLRQYATEDAARSAGTSIWFEDLAGHVAPPELVLWRVPLQLRVVVTPAQIAYGVPVQVTVRAWDTATGAEIVDPASSIVIDGDATGYALGQTFQYTFEPSSEPVSAGVAGLKPLPVPRPVPRAPQGVVQTGRYPPTAIPFSFSAPVRPRRPG